MRSDVPDGPAPHPAAEVLQLSERGLIDLDAPAGGYLRAYRLIPAKPPLTGPRL